MTSLKSKLLPLKPTIQKAHDLIVLIEKFEVMLYLVPNVKLKHLKKKSKKSNAFSNVEFQVLGPREHSIVSDASSRSVMDDVFDSVTSLGYYVASPSR